MNPAAYFKQYRDRMGFASQAAAKDFLSAKDITAEIDYGYIASLNQRLGDIVRLINSVVHPVAQRPDLEPFIRDKVEGSYRTLKSAGLIPKLNNQGRRPEEVLFSWLRGSVVVEFFVPAFSHVFGVQIGEFCRMGEDNLSKPDTFRRSPKADLELCLGGTVFRIEVQAGFQGINDIKEHKVREAKRAWDTNGIRTICIHLDLFNGQTAFKRLDRIEDGDVHFVTRQQMEGQTVFALDQNDFKWRLTDPLPMWDELELSDTLP